MVSFISITTFNLLPLIISLIIMDFGFKAEARFFNYEIVCIET